MACRAREAFPPCSLDGRVHVHAWFRNQFKDKIWNALESNARWQLSPQGRLFFEFETNQIKVNNVFDTSKSVSHHGHGSSSSSPGDSALHMSRGGSEAVVGPHATLWMSSSSVVVVVLCAVQHPSASQRGQPGHVFLGRELHRRHALDREAAGPGHRQHLLQHLRVRGAVPRPTSSGRWQQPTAIEEACLSP